MDIVIDIQGFRDLCGKFIPKEIAVVGVASPIIGHWIITPPCPFEDLPENVKRENNWLSQYYHGIEWFDGEADLEYVVLQLREIARGSRHIYTRGVEKLLYLQRLLSRNINNLEEISPAFKNLPDCGCNCCPHHGFRQRSKFLCALRNANKLKYWLVTRENSDTVSETTSLEKNTKISDFIKKKNKKNLTHNITEWLKNSPEEDEGLAKEERAIQEPNNSENNTKSSSAFYNTVRRLLFATESATTNKEVKII